MKILLLAKILATQACRQCKAILSQWESILLCFALTYLIENQEIDLLRLLSRWCAYEHRPRQENWSSVIIH